MSFLNVFEKPQLDSNINKIEIHSYSPLYSGNYNRSDEIRICISNQDSYLLPCDSYLYVEGNIDNETSIAQIHLTNNFISFMFDEVRLEINGISVSEARNFGITSTMKLYTSLTIDEAQQGDKFGWFYGYKDCEKNSTFSYLIPCSHILGFFDYFRGILVNVKLELVLIRAKNENNCFESTTEGANVKINLTKIQLRMPLVYLNDITKLHFLKAVDRGHSFQVLFKEWSLYESPVQSNTSTQSWTIRTTSSLERPRYVILAFQSDRKNNTKRNASLFDDSSITNVKLFLNDVSYPYENLNVDFRNNHYTTVYHMFNEFKKSFFGDVREYITYKEFKKYCPFFIIDCLYQNEVMKIGSIDIRVEYQASANIPQNTCCYALIIHDRIIEYNPLNSTVNRIV